MRHLWPFVLTPEGSQLSGSTAGDVCLDPSPILLWGQWGEVHVVNVAIHLALTLSANESSAMFTTVNATRVNLRQIGPSTEWTCSRPKVSIRCIRQRIDWTTSGHSTCHQMGDQSVSNSIKGITFKVLVIKSAPPLTAQADESTCSGDASIDYFHPFSAAIFVVRAGRKETTRDGQDDDFFG